MTIFIVLLQVSAPYKYLCPIIGKQHSGDRKHLNENLSLAKQTTSGVPKNVL